MPRFKYPDDYIVADCGCVYHAAQGIPCRHDRLKSDPWGDDWWAQMAIRGLEYMDDRLGFVDTTTDQSYMMDDFGNLKRVPFDIGGFYFQEA